MAKFRHEIKHYITYSDYMIIRNRLIHLMDRDSHGDENGEYRVRSLYFDNLYDKALKEKLNGINKREKFRIRFYNNDHSFIRLEKKCKNNNLIIKYSTLITKKECELLLEGNKEFLIESKDPLLNEFYSKLQGQLLRPKRVIDYIREAYTFPAGNIRITFDKSVKTSLYSTNLFDENLSTINAVDSRLIIFEIKYDEYLPELIRSAIQTNKHQASAISKYAISRIYM